MTSTDTATTDAPESLRDILATQINTLPAIQRAPEIRRRIAAVQDQIAGIEGQLQASASALAAEQAKHDHAAAAALAAGKPIPPAPPAPKANTAEHAELRRQVAALEPVLAVLQRLDRDGEAQEFAAFADHMRAFNEDLTQQAQKRHAQFVGDLIKLLDPYELPGVYLIEAVCDLVHTVQEVDSIEERAFKAKLEAMRAIHPGPARKMRLEYQWRRLTRSTMSTEFVKEQVQQHLAKRGGK